MTYRVEVAPSAQRQLGALPRDLQRRMLPRLQGLAADPRPPGSLKMTGEEHHRIRVGDYRVIYEVNDAERLVVVVAVGHRREVYR